MKKNRARTSPKQPVTGSQAGVTPTKSTTSLKLSDLLDHPPRRGRKTSPATGSQTTEAPQAGAPLTLEQALQRIAELERDNEARAVEDKHRFIFGISGRVADSYLESALDQFTQQIAYKIAEVYDGTPEIGLFSLREIVNRTYAGGYESAPCDPDELLCVEDFLAEFERDLRARVAKLQAEWAEAEAAKGTAA